MKQAFFTLVFAFYKKNFLNLRLVTTDDLIDLKNILWKTNNNRFCVASEHSLMLDVSDRFER